MRSEKSVCLCHVVTCASDVSRASERLIKRRCDDEQRTGAPNKDDDDDDTPKGKTMDGTEKGRRNKQDKGSRA
jgi:hypothetical protein